MAFRRMSGFDLPENGGNIRDHIYVDAGLAAAGGPYAYFPSGSAPRSWW